MDRAAMSMTATCRWYIGVTAGRAGGPALLTDTGRPGAKAAVKMRCIATE